MRYGMVPEAVFTARAKKLITHADISVYAAIASFSNRDGYAFPGEERVAAMTGILQSSVSRCLTRLIKADLLRTKNPRKQGRPNEYILIKHPISTRKAKESNNDSRSEGKKCDFDDLFTDIV